MEDDDRELLKSCKACGNDISRHSPFCRHCGHPQGGPLVIWLLIVLLVVMIGAYLAFTIYGICHAEELERADTSGGRSSLPRNRLLTS